MGIFLTEAVRRINHDRKYLPDHLNYTVQYKKNERSFASAWFRTAGCRFSRSGGCTICDYFISQNVTEENMFAYFCEAMDELPEIPDLLLIQTSGSFLDPDEVPVSVRRKIYAYIAEKLPEVFLVFETHVSTVTEDVIKELLTFFPPQRLRIEIGIETSNEWIRKYCINKWVTNYNLQQVIRRLNQSHISVTANFVIGIPFLTAKENIEYAAESINWAIRNGIATISLFPVNLKPYTLAYWMERHGMYRQPSLWMLVDVLSRVRTVFLPRIDINWYESTVILENPLYEHGVKVPYSCDVCYSKVESCLNRYFIGDVSRKEILDELNRIQCGCRDEYRWSLDHEPQTDLQSRVLAGYRKIGTELLGVDFMPETDNWQWEAIIEKEKQR